MSVVIPKEINDNQTAVLAVYLLADLALLNLNLVQLLECHLELLLFGFYEKQKVMLGVARLVVLTLGIGRVSQRALSLVRVHEDLLPVI